MLILNRVAYSPVQQSRKMSVFYLFCLLNSLHYARSGGSRRYNYLNSNSCPAVRFMVSPWVEIQVGLWAFTVGFGLSQVWQSGVAQSGIYFTWNVTVINLCSHAVTDRQVFISLHQCFTQSDVESPGVYAPGSAFLAEVNFHTQECRSLLASCS